jgi:hypothetical protein
MEDGGKVIIDLSTLIRLLNLYNIDWDEDKGEVDEYSTVIATTDKDGDKITYTFDMCGRLVRSDWVIE